MGVCHGGAVQEAHVEVAATAITPGLLATPSTLSALLEHHGLQQHVAALGQPPPPPLSPPLSPLSPPSPPPSLSTAAIMAAAPLTVAEAAHAAERRKSAPLRQLHRRLNEMAEQGDIAGCDALVGPVLVLRRGGRHGAADSSAAPAAPAASAAPAALLQPSAHTFSILLKACARARPRADVSAAEGFWRLMERGRREWPAVGAQ